MQLFNGGQAIVVWAKGEKMKAKYGGIVALILIGLVSAVFLLGSCSGGGGGGESGIVRDKN